jgi:hypothetical protein
MDVRMEPAGVPASGWSGKLVATFAVVLITGCGAQRAVNHPASHSSSSSRMTAAPAALPSSPSAAGPTRSIASMRGYYAKPPARIKRLLIENSCPGTHGWDLLTAPNGGLSPLAVAVVHWVLGHTDGRRPAAVRSLCD